MQPALHVIGLPHTHPTHRFSTCAYTAKIKKFATMMHRLGWRVILYAGHENEAECAEHVPLFTEAERLARFGPWNPNQCPNVDWDPARAYWRTINGRAIEAIASRMQPRDFLCLVAGRSQAVIAQAYPEMLPVEWAVGYSGIHLKHRVFESYAWMHHVYGLKGIQDGAAYDAVIPNFFDPDDFPALPRGERKYLLFIGRLIARKGPHIAAAIAGRAGLPLVIAGPGALKVTRERIEAADVTITGSHIEHVGAVGPERRAELMSGAVATIVPTMYIEPFGGVAVESMMAGTPVIASDWGAFVETVQPGISGERFRTLAEGAAAVETVAALDRERVREFAIGRYGLDPVGRQFAAHFNRLGTLWGKGWYE